jgi:hypothetical protein
MAEKDNLTKDNLTIEEAKEISDRCWYRIYFLVIATNAILLLLFWLFSRYFSS